MLNHRFCLKLLLATVGLTVFIMVLDKRVPATYAQATYASLTGMVVDETGAVVPDVNVTVININTGFQREAVTNDEGRFTIPLLPPGTYTLTAEMPGFATVTVSDIIVQVSINPSLEIILRPGAIIESISVSASGSANRDSIVQVNNNQVDATNATAKYAVTNDQVISLPVLTSRLGRNTLGALSFLVPGISPTTTLGPSMPEANMRGSQMSINGGRPSSISFNLDGGDNNDNELNQAAAPMPNPDALQEFTAITNNYQADLGRSSGGIINAVTKSGTNRYSGNLRHFIINEALNARGFFDTEVPLDRLNTYGGQIGGPVILPRIFNGKDRTFFFFDYEGTRARRESTSTLIVPTRAERVGDFSHLPSSQWPRDPITKERFPDGRIPADRINPISRLYLARYIPTANDGERNFRQLLLTRFQTHQLTARLDHQMTDADNLSVTIFSTISNTDAGLATLPVRSKRDTRSKNLFFALRQTHTFSAGTVNQLAFTATRFFSGQTPSSPGAMGVHPSGLGFTGVHPQSVNALAIPSVNIAGPYAPVNTETLFVDAKTAWQIKDDLSHVDGNHSFKFGGEWHAFIQNRSVEGNNGSFTFSEFSSNNSVANFLLGIPYSYTQTSGHTIYPRQRAYYFYAMDDWRIRRNLTINLGLRYELSPPFKEELDRVSVFRPGDRSRRFPNAPEGLLFVGDRDPLLRMVPRGAYSTDKNDLAPRFGIAYSPSPQSKYLRWLFGEGKTALRAGWGVFYDQTLGSSLTQFSSTQPFSVSQTLYLRQLSQNDVSFANPFGTLPNLWPMDLSKGIFIDYTAVQPIDPMFRTAYTYQYNLTIQRELAWALLLEVAYVGNNSFKINRERELNLGKAGPGNLQLRRTFPQFGNILLQESSGRARYDSLQFRLARRFNSGLKFDLSYVFGKALDNGSYPVFTSLDGLRWARSSFDRTHNFVASYTYSLPTLKCAGLIGGIVNGWQVSAITELRSGLPMNFYQFYDTTLTTHFPGNPDFVGPYRRLDPRKYQTILVDGVTQSGHFFFDPNAFRQVPLNYKQPRPGTLGRNLFDGPGINLTSFSLIKRIRLSESQNLMLRSDIRNLFNHAQFQSPSLYVGYGSTLGQVLSASPGRNIQLSLRYSF